MLPPELQLLGRVIEPFQLRADWWRLARIALWTIGFLALANMLLGDPPRIASSASEGRHPELNMMLTRSTDPRWVMSERRAFGTSQKPDIAWVTGSAGKLSSVTPTEFLAGDTQAVLKQQFGVDTNMYLYYLEAARLIDAYTATLDALARDPDIIVVELDPLWIYNPWSVYRNKNVFNGAADLWWSRRDWPLQFLFVAPRNHAWALAGEFLPRVSIAQLKSRIMSIVRRVGSISIADAQASAASLTAPKVAGQSPALIPTGGGAEADEPAPQPAAERRGLLPNMQFWMLYRNSPEQLAELFPNGTRDIDAWQINTLVQADTRTDLWSAVFMERLFEVLAQSDIDAIIYLAPIKPAVLDRPDAAAAYDSIVADIRRLAAKHQDSQLRVLDSYPDVVLKSIVHHDQIHMFNPGLLPGFFAQNLISTLHNEQISH